MNLENLGEYIQEEILSWAEAHPDHTCLLMIDPSLRNPLEVEGGCEEFGGWGEFSPSHAEQAEPLAIHETLFPPEHLPRLIPLDFNQENDQIILDASIALMIQNWMPENAPQKIGHCICGWLWVPNSISENPAQTVAKHMGKQCVQFDISKKGRIFMRFFDPRSLDLLWPKFSDTQRATIFGPIQSWHMLTRTGELTRFSVPGNAISLTGERIKLTTGQWETINNIGIVNRSLLLAQVGQGIVIDETAIAITERAILHAKHYDIVNQDDVVTFAYLALTKHPRFYEHPVFQGVFDAIRQGTEFSSAINTISSYQWEQIAATKAN